MVQDLFLTETARAPMLFFRRLSAYEKNGTVTNVTAMCRSSAAGPRRWGRNRISKSSLFLPKTCAKIWAAEVGRFPGDPKPVRGYDLPLDVIETGGAAQPPLNGHVERSIRGRKWFVRRAIPYLLREHWDDTRIC